MGDWVATVNGPVETGHLGHAQLHEHLFVRPTPASRANPALEIADESQSARELMDYKRAGGGAILDAQPLGAGRDAAKLRAISRVSGVHIIAVTGVHMPFFYPDGHDAYHADPEALYEAFLREIRDGITDDPLPHDPSAPPIRAGAVKAAIGPDGAVGRFADNLRAAARAAYDGGVPLVLHTEAGRGALGAIDLCGRAGLAPDRMLICHADRQAADFSAHEAIAATGAYLEYDTIARFKYHDDDDERRLIRHMAQCGYLKQLLLSLDTTAARLARYGGEIGLSYLITDFLPALKHDGFTDADIQILTVSNPARAIRSAH